MDERSGDLHAVTGAYSYTGRHIADRLRSAGFGVRALVRERPVNPGESDIRQLQCDDEDQLARDLEGASVLHNTYWIRFERGDATFAAAVRNTAVLARAARRAGVKKIVHLSVSNPSVDSPFGYFRGKAAAEASVTEAGVPVSVIRPTLVFGGQDILVSNIAWLLRRLHAFLLPGSGEYRVQPVFVEDVAALALDQAQNSASNVLDAAGPEVLRFRDLLKLLADSIGSKAIVVGVPTRVAILAASALSAGLRDVLITPEEIGALMAECLVSAAPPTTPTTISSWLEHSGETLGHSYRSEIRRHWT